MFSSSLGTSCVLSARSLRWTSRRLYDCEYTYALSALNSALHRLSIRSFPRAAFLPTVLRGLLPLLPYAPFLTFSFTHLPAALSHQPLKKRTGRNDRRNARAPAPQPFVQVAESSQKSRALLLVDVRVSDPSSPIANASAPILVCPRVSATPSPIARARAAESRPLTPASRSTQATRAPLLVPVRVSVVLFPLARAPATESRPQVSVARSLNATRAPLLVPIRVSVPLSPLARAPATEPRQLPNLARMYLLYAPYRLLQFSAPGPQSLQYRAPHLFL